MLDHRTIERYELGWLVVSVVLVVMLFAGVLGSMISETVPGFFGARSSYVDPAHLTGTPFATPGLHRNADGTLDAYIVARAFAFQPSTLRVPAGQRVTLHLLSVDVIHGLMLEQGNVNVELIPGQVANLPRTFTRPGTYTTECNEYCGSGHQTMAFHLVVEPPTQPEATK
ncbi:cytochrome C oxidase subunit II [Deinococcus aquiradiocola]|uniref:Cytochrome c oxidase subunit 2 n=1 Tax=Deinococcus aquiradiocola TaxID=393059 RepID=A0A917PBB9_9DEIO|nr:cytochrome C oxidase subunit II [Deinococcus aquiradiocola]GGJ69238.1 cytochrome c oxidase subunit 2 [Deinococcus aquiradiocola]